MPSLSRLELLCVALIVDHAVNASLTSLPLPLATLLYLGLESPCPPRAFFSLLLAYLLALISIKLAYQLPLVCGTPPLSLRTAHGSANGTEYWCSSTSSAVPESLFMPTLSRRVDYALGLDKSK